MKTGKRILSMLLCVLLLTGGASVSAAAADDDNWTTVQQDIFDNFNDEKPVIGTASVSANGNDIKIVITSDWINDDRLYCPGTATCPEHELWGDADGRLWDIDFADGDLYADETANQLSFRIEHDCGGPAPAVAVTATTKPFGAAGESEPQATVGPHTVSLRRDVYIGLYYRFYTEESDEYGSHSYSGSVAPGYYGRLETGIENLHITSEGHTITVTTTLPDKVVDYRNEDAREMRFQSDKLKMNAQVTCFYSHNSDADQPDVPQEKQTLIQKIVAHVRAVFEKFFALFRRIFGLQSADAAQPSDADTYRTIVFPDGRRAYVPLQP